MAQIKKPKLLGTYKGTVSVGMSAYDGRLVLIDGYVQTNGYFGFAVMCIVNSLAYVNTAGLQPNMTNVLSASFITGGNTIQLVSAFWAGNNVTADTTWRIWLL